MRVAVIGCGAIGGFLAAALARRGHQPLCIEQNQEIVDRLNEHGLHVTGKMGRLHEKVRVFPDISQVPGTFDVIFITVKNTVLHAVFEEAKEKLCRDGFIVTNQNGIEIMAIAKKFKDVKIVAGAVMFNAEALEYGEYLIRSKGGIVFGPLNGGNRDDYFMLRSLLYPIIPVYYQENVEGMLWSKLLIVCGVTGLGGVSGLAVGKMFLCRPARKLFYRIATEGSLIAEKLGIELVQLPGSKNPQKFGNHDAGLPLFFRAFMLFYSALKYWKLKSNFQRDLEQGKTTEVDYLNGAVVREGKGVGVATPVNSRVVEYVRQIEDDEDPRGMDKENLSEIFEDDRGKELRKMYTR
jgi:2-dehydropantoate 2-reductase